jgi:hypothetical protein
VLRQVALTDPAGEDLTVTCRRGNRERVRGKAEEDITGEQVSFDVPVAARSAGPRRSPSDGRSWLGREVANMWPRERLASRPATVVEDQDARDPRRRPAGSGEPRASSG